MNTAAVTPVETVTAIFRVCEYAVPFVLAAPLWRRHWDIMLAAALGMIVALLALRDDTLLLRTYMGPMVVAMISVVFVRRLQADSATLSAYMAAREADWAKQRHALMNDLAAEKLKVEQLVLDAKDQPPEQG